jgi:hypothetical protein
MRIIMDFKTHISNLQTNETGFYLQIKSQIIHILYHIIRYFSWRCQPGTPQLSYWSQCCQTSRILTWNNKFRMTWQENWSDWTEPYKRDKFNINITTTGNGYNAALSTCNSHERRHTNSMNDWWKHLYLLYKILTLRQTILRTCFTKDTATV